MSEIQVPDPYVAPDPYAVPDLNVPSSEALLAHVLSNTLREVHEIRADLKRIEKAVNELGIKLLDVKISPPKKR